MRTTVYKIVITITVLLFLVVGILVGVNIINSRENAMNKATDNLEYMSENCADEFRAVFDNSEMLVDNMSSIMSRVFLLRETQEDPANVHLKMEEMRALTKELTASSKYPICLYTTFDPQYFMEDVCCVKNTDGSIELSSAEDEETQEEWLKIWRERTSELGRFYWDTVETGELWFELYYDSEIQWEVVSRGKAVYDREGKLLGIVGADVYVGDIEKTLDEINEKTGGTSSLTNSKGQLIAGKRIDENKLKSGRYIHASSRIDDRWEITIIQPVKNVFDLMKGTIITLILLGIAMFVLILAAIVFIYKRHGRFIIETSEEKDLMLINQERQAQMGEMVGNIAHQLKQPLNGVNMALSNLKEEYESNMPDEERTAFAERIGRIKLRITDMSETVQEFIGFVKPQKEKEPFSVKTQIEKNLDLMVEGLQLDFIIIKTTGEDFLVKGYKNEFGQCIFNILDNARYALRSIGGGRVISIVLGRKEHGRKSLGEIKIINNGLPLADDVIDRIFDIYFTTREGSGGSGIGLYMTRQIIESRFDGSISCRNTDDGVCFDILLPLWEEGEESTDELDKQS